MATRLVACWRFSKIHDSPSGAMSCRPLPLSKLAEEQQEEEIHATRTLSLCSVLPAKVCVFGVCCFTVT